MVDTVSIPGTPYDPWNNYRSTHPGAYSEHSHVYPKINKQQNKKYIGRISFKSYDTEFHLYNVSDTKNKITISGLHLGEGH